MELQGLQPEANYLGNWDPKIYHENNHDKNNWKSFSKKKQYT